MWKRKRTLKEEYGTLGHFLRGDNECHYLGDLYIEGTNFYFHREWRFFISSDSMNAATR